MATTKPCPANLEIRVNGIPVAGIVCSLEWPHLDRDHAFEWPVDPDDIVLAQLDIDLENGGPNRLESPHHVD